MPEPGCWTAGAVWAEAMIARQMSVHLQKAFVVVLISLDAYQEPALRIRFDVTDEPVCWCAGGRKAAMTKTRVDNGSGRSSKGLSRDGSLRRVTVLMFNDFL